MFGSGNSAQLKKRQSVGTSVASECKVRTFVSIQPNVVTEMKWYELHDPEGVVHTAQAEGLGTCPCL